MSLIPIAIADLGANLDAALTATGVDGRWMYGSPPLLTAHIIVSTNTATLRLYVYDDELARWFPSEAAAQVVAVGVRELRFNTAAVPGNYALVQEAGAGTAVYRFHSGHN